MSQYITARLMASEGCAVTNHHRRNSSRRVRARKPVAQRRDASRRCATRNTLVGEVVNPPPLMAPRWPGLEASAPTGYSLIDSIEKGVQLVEDLDA